MSDCPLICLYTFFSAISKTILYSLAQSCFAPGEVLKQIYFWGKSWNRKKMHFFHLAPCETKYMHISGQQKHRD